MNNTALAPAIRSITPEQHLQLIAREAVAKGPLKFDSLAPPFRSLPWKKCQEIMDRYGARGFMVEEEDGFGAKIHVTGNDFYKRRIKALKNAGPVFQGSIPLPSHCLGNYNL
jgi:hypothetical protein